MTTLDLNQQAFDAAYAELYPYSALRGALALKNATAEVVHQLRLVAQFWGIDRVQSYAESIDNPERTKWIQDVALTATTGFPALSLDYAVQAAARVLVGEG